MSTFQRFSVFTKGAYASVAPHRNSRAFPGYGCSLVSVGSASSLHHGGHGHCYPTGCGSAVATDQTCLDVILTFWFVTLPQIFIHQNKTHLSHHNDPQTNQLSGVTTQLAGLACATGLGRQAQPRGITCFCLVNGDS